MKKYLKLSVAALVAALALTYLNPVTRAWATTMVTPAAVSTWPYTLLTLSSQTTLTSAATETHSGSVSFSGTTTFTGNRLGAIPSAQTVAAAFQIAADACGGTKLISSAGVVSSSTTTPFPAAAAGNAGCSMDIVNVGASAITVKVVAGSYNWAGAADVVLGSSDSFRVGSSGSQWYQIGATGNN